MKLFRPRRKPEKGEEEKDLLLDTDADLKAEAPAETPALESDPLLLMGALAGGEVEALAETPALESDPLLLAGAVVDREVETETLAETPAQAEAEAPAQVEMEEKASEAEEGTPASEPGDVPIQDLLSDLKSISRSLGIDPQTRTEPDRDETPDASAESGEAGDATELSIFQRLRALRMSLARYRLHTRLGPFLALTDLGIFQRLRALRTSLARYRRHTRLGLFLALVGATAIGGALWGLGQLTSSEPIEDPPAVTATAPAAVVRQEGPTDGAAPPTQEAPSVPSSEAIPEPTPEPQPAYLLYAVQPGECVFCIARDFGISPDYILWNNADVIYEPDLVRAGEELLIPSIDGMIYRVQPGDTLSDIAASYQVDVESILGFAPNGLTSPDDQIEGMTLVLPGAVPPSSR